MSSTPHRTAKHAVLPLAACAVAALSAFAAPSASAQALQAQRVVIDPYTGRARMPEHDEIAAAAAAARTAAAAARTNTARTTAQSHPLLATTSKPVMAQFGAKGFKTDPSRMAYSVVRRNADGTFSERCVTGADSAEKALQAAQGDRHDQ
jgi:hypothetical protein